MTAERDHQAEQDHAEFAGWAEAQGYDDGERYDFDEMREAFTAGMQAERDLAAPQPAPELAAATDETRERLDLLEERIGNLAAGLKLSASSSHPSKKSEIETSVHNALLALLDPR